MNPEEPAPLAQPGPDSLAGVNRPVVGSSATGSSVSPPIIPDYQVFKRIGGGSYGEVWLVRSLVGTYRAAKVVSRRSFERDQPFEREFRGIQRFEPISHSHESQVKILHVGRNDQAGYFYYVMELADDAADERNDECRMSNVEKKPSIVSSFVIHHSSLYTPRTLKLELQRRGRLPMDQCLRIGLSLATALEHLHGHGLIHRDVKPSNIIFVNGTAKLADIGLVTDVEATRSFVGTEGFIPPEGPGTVQADLYSLGKVLYEISMGRNRLDFPALPANWDELPAEEQARLLEFNEVLVKACESEPCKRYQSAHQMNQDLALLQHGKSVKRKNTAKRRRAVAAGICLVLTLLATILVFLPFLRGTSAHRALPISGEARSIGVLPFAYDSENQKEGYLGESLAEELRRALAQVNGVKVAAPESSFVFKDWKGNRQEIARKLKVSHLLEGRIRKSGDLLTIGVTLIEAGSDQRLWARTSDCRIGDLARIETEIAQSVASAFAARLGEEQARRLVRLPTENPKAYQLYLQGSYSLHRWSGTTIDPAIGALEKAVELDGNFAQAQALLAEAYVQKAFTFDAQQSWQAKASGCIQAALSLDPNCAEAFLARAKFLWSPWNRFRHEQAVKDLRHALELDPNLADAHQHLAMVYVHLGLFDKAREAARHALELDPLNPGALYREGVSYLYEGRYPDALSTFEQVPPEHQSALLSMQTATALFYLGQTNEASSRLERLLSEKPDDSLLRSTLAILYAASGEATKAEQEIDRATETEQGSLGHYHHVSYNIGCAFALLKNGPRAIPWLRKSADEGFPCYPRFEKDSLLDNLRADAQFVTFLEQLRNRFQQYRKAL
jgi:serine/threonine protein kinase/TolB-like protein